MGTLRRWRHSIKLRLLGVFLLLAFLVAFIFIGGAQKAFTLGWREADVVAMLGGFGARQVHFLPDDQPAVDRALVAGRLLVESGESPLTRAVGALVDAMAGVRR